ncbi:MAG: rane bound O-acyl transferase family protein [Pseudobdellovibrio sp.]|jgi:D-alanyl-lipoteichoic acid acyltransferase DltB (MBOAT superfamily)|nr:rane bound O-acyl transferase family protein [Pseudobdellovibrio sp.]
MSFDNFIFWIIFVFVLALYLVSKRTLQNYILLAASFFFYSFWSLKFTAILLVTSTIDYIVAILLDRTEKLNHRRALLGVSLFSNIGVLFFFKYYLFFTNSYQSLGDIFPAFPELYKWGLPLGISFYTFQILSYTIDVYKRRIKATNNWANYTLFVMFFPQLVAGPIEKARSLLRQIEADRNVSYNDIEQGALLCLWGYFKKIFAANALTYPLAFYTAHKGPLGLPLVLLLGLLQTILVYLDFSAYSDMARGMARCLGIKLIINYRPFWFAKNPTEFWQRWHTSLTNWIREYVVLPIRNKNASLTVEYFKIIFVMVLVGLWHAPKLNWLLFGLFNGILIVADQLLAKSKNIQPLRYVLFLFLIFGCGLLHLMSEPAFFQSVSASFNNISDLTYVSELLLYTASFVLPVFIVESFAKFHEAGEKNYLQGFFPKAFLVSACLIGILFLDRKAGQGFIYFQF